MFQRREPTEQELREGLQRVGVSTKSQNKRTDMFSAFRDYAQERQGQHQGLAPVNPYSNINIPLSWNSSASGQGDSTGNNPYTQGNLGASGSSGSHNDYAQQNTANPYAQSRQNPYIGNRESRMYGGAYGSNGASGATGTGETDANSNSTARRPNPYERTSSRTSGARDGELIIDLNDVPSIAPPVRFNKPARRRAAIDTETLDLNELPDEDDLNVEVDDFLPEQEQVNSEDEEIEAIKQDIRFTKQESLALTRNTLRMAQEADASGINTLGVLGSQSERLYNAEQNLLLADTQTKLAEEKVKYLNRLNRSIFVPVAAGNPFNRKSKLRQQEQKLKSEKQQEKSLRETNRQGIYDSEQRIKEGITNSSTTSETFNKYQGEKYLNAALRYQFENDSEDDEVEKELGANLDQIHAFSKKLKNTATVIGQEVEAQNSRLRRIEEDADRLDINVHLNSLRLGNIR